MADLTNSSDGVASMAAGNQGLDMGRQHAGRPFAEVEGRLEQGWQQAKGAPSAAWQDMTHAVRDAFERVGHR